MSSTIIDLNNNNNNNGQSQQQDPVIHLHSGSSANNNSNNNNAVTNNNNNNNAINNNNNNSNNSNSTNAPHDHAGTAAILARLKELEAANQQLTKHLDDVKSDATKKEEKIKLLSADKRKDMEQIIETAVDTWLNSLTGISEDVRKQFRTGVSRIAEQADLKNAAWEVVCQASQLHQTNVNRIEELIQTCNSQSETIKSLVGSGTAASQLQNDPSFSSEASRMLNANNKRARTDDHVFAHPAAPVAGVIPHSSSTNAAGAGGGGAAPATGAGGGDAWDMFDGMLREQSRALYY